MGQIEVQHYTKPILAKIAMYQELLNVLRNSNSEVKL